MLIYFQKKQFDDLKKIIEFLKSEANDLESYLDDIDFDTGSLDCCDDLNCQNGDTVASIQSNVDDALHNLINIKTTVDDISCLLDDVEETSKNLFNNQLELFPEDSQTS